jgi:hypothetical protein
MCQHGGLLVLTYVWALFFVIKSEVSLVSLEFKGGSFMTRKKTYQLPKWASRVKRSQIERLYRRCGKGILDEELIDDVGFSLYARCKSMLEIDEARGGRVTCANCQTIIFRNCELKNETIKCTSCQWRCDWQEYVSTYKGKLLVAGNMKPAFIEFVNKFPGTKKYGDKLVLIDTLIHRFHGELCGGGKKPVTYGLIEGNISDIAAFLDRLNYGDAMPEHIRINRQEWRKQVRTATRFWSDQLKSNDD